VKFFPKFHRASKAIRYTRGLPSAADSSQNIRRHQIERHEVKSQSASPADDALHPLMAELAASINQVAALESKAQAWLLTADTAACRKDAIAHEVMSGLLAMLAQALAAHTKTAAELHASLMVIVQMAAGEAARNQLQQGE